MAVVTFSKKLFEKDVGKLDEEMQSKIALFGTPVEEVTDNEVHIEVFPNRPDLLSYYGFKRSFLAFLGRGTGLKTYKVNKPEKNYRVIIDSSVKEVRPYTACAIVRGLSLDDEKIRELIEIQEKLHNTVGRKRKKMALGIYPIEEITLPITFKAIEPDKIKFVPLETDRELSGLEILQKHPKGKEFAHLLAGKARFPVFVDSKKQILSMVPIINSNLTGKVTNETKNVFVECSGFDLETLKTCLNIIVTSLGEMGGKIYQMELDYGIGNKEITPNLTPRKMKLSIENTNKLLGLDLKEKQIKTCLEKMGYNYNQSKNTAEIPAWRADVLHEVDLIEDIAIAYGYDNFIPEIPEISTIGSEDAKETMKRRVSEILSGIEILEVSNYHLTSKKDQTEKMNVSEKHIFAEVENSKTEYSVLRETLTPLLLKNFSENVDSEYPQKIFETGRVFTLEDSDKKITEKESFASAISPGNFTEIKQIIEYLFKMIGQEITIKEAINIPEHFIEGRTAKVIYKEKEIGFMGEIHPKILKNWKIRMPVALIEIEIDEILKTLSS